MQMQKVPHLQLILVLLSRRELFQQLQTRLLLYSEYTRLSIYRGFSLGGGSYRPVFLLTRYSCLVFVTNQLIALSSQLCFHFHIYKIRKLVLETIKVTFLKAGKRKEGVGGKSFVYEIQRQNCSNSLQTQIVKLTNLYPPWPLPFACLLSLASSLHRDPATAHSLLVSSAALKKGPVRAAGLYLNHSHPWCF